MGEMLAIPGLELPLGPVRRAADGMVDQLRDDGRLTVEDEPLAQMLLKLSDTLDAAHGGKGAYAVAQVAAQLQNVWLELKRLDVPAGADVEAFEVALMPVADAG